MYRLALGFGFIFLAVIFIGVLALGFTTTRANLVQAQANSYQAQANAAQAATGFVDKCLSGFLFFTLLFAGITIGVGLSTFRSARRQGRVFLDEEIHPTAPNFPVQTHIQSHLPASEQSLPVYYLPDSVENKNAEEDFLFKDWGW